MLRQGFMVLLLAAALSGCVNPPTPEPVPSGQIDGAVVDNFLRPWADVEVRLVELDWTTRTTDLGGFSFFDVPLGFHTVEVELASVGIDRELVVVEEDHATKTILQIYSVPPPSPYVSQLTHHASMQVATPGDMCGDCRWNARMHDEKPVAAVMMAVWDGRIARDMETHIILEVHDQNGGRVLPPMRAEDVVYDAQGRSVLYAAIRGDRIPDSATSLLVTVRFDPNNPMPQVDFELETFMFFHYGMTEEAAALLS